MRIQVAPGSRLSGDAQVPGDKSIAHRWLILAATAIGTSRLEELPLSLDVRSTAACLGTLIPKARPAVELWLEETPPMLEGGRSTWNPEGRARRIQRLEVEGEGHIGIAQPSRELDCGNSGTSMRLLAGVVAGAPVRTVLTGDPSLSVRPMERVAVPLRAMGAEVSTTEGHAPVSIAGGRLKGIRYESPVTSAQVKSAVLFAGLTADGPTTVVEPAPTRDHTERALTALGAPVSVGHGVTIERFQHDGFAARVPGDPSAAAFLVAAAALTGSSITVHDVGLNPTRLRFLDVMARMGISVRVTIDREELGEPVGSLHVDPAGDLLPVRVEADELPLVIDEVPILAILAAFTRGDSWFLGSGELRVKESDRVAAIVSGIRALGGHAAEQGDELVVAGGGLTGGTAVSGGDHRMGMSFAVGALAAKGPSEVGGMEAADVSFPGFIGTLSALGATLEEVP